MAAAMKTVSEVLEPAEPTSKEEKRGITVAGCVRVIALIFEIVGIVKVSGREAKAVGWGKEIARRASRIDLRRCRRCDEGGAADEQKCREPDFSAIH
jgi:hypothetical protein